ncbi:NAD(P)/FAD-dependent oxidoreductase [Paenibacillus soyae]|uniref:NAD(P)/FAD-dependent oxidoreductase n=1 Tax=Paenibacillus soyae TaxID=2969249 RepID=A0A9X2MX06_9BACL|nr:NAD(P)/FAD-dependent oxidoreductase [Paenibacillus soyae]MCR2807990.1 NAD(P)/FAD-dependent oxidoreductase [Paenibacillus soyae]
MNHYDCAIVGGGPAGLNAALVLGRARRSVALLDNNQPRNGVTHASHGFLTRDGVQPAEFRRIAYEEVLKYPSVQHVQEKVTEIERTEQGFVLHGASGVQITARKLILAAGLREELPEIEGVRDYYGKSLFVCPFCDGWELKDQPLTVISDTAAAFHKTKLVLNWSSDVVLCTNGSDHLSAEQRQQLERRGVQIVDTPVVSVSGRDGLLKRVHFADGTSIERSGGFVDPVQIPNAAFAEALGYQTTANGGIVTDPMGKTNADGVYAAGDSAYVMPSQLILAAASGSKAAMTVFADLVEEDWQGLEQ